MNQVSQKLLYLNFAERYRPQKLSEVINLDEAKAKVNEFIINSLSKERKTKNIRKKALLLYGPTGSGKTALVYALANNANAEVIEINASDFRNKKSINKVIGNALRQQSLFSNKKIIIIDEVDAVAGREDYGGLSEINKLIEISTWPIVLIANKPFDKRLSSLRKKCSMVEIKKLNYMVIIKILERICRKEDIKIELEGLKNLAINSLGDARAAINDLEVVSAGNKVVSLNDINDYIENSKRDKEQSIFNALRLVFKSNTAQLDIFNNVDSNLDEILYWIDENLPLEYKGKDLMNGYDSLSKANIFLNRIHRWQYWRFLVYVNIFITAGITAAKTNIGFDRTSGFTPYKRPIKFLMMWQSKQDKEKNSRIKFLARKLHCSKKKAMMELPYLRGLFENVY